MNINDSVLKKLMVPLQYKPDEGDNASLDPVHISPELTLAIKRYPKLMSENSITRRNILGVCMSNLAILTLYSRLVSFFIYGGFLAFLAVSDQGVSTASFSSAVVLSIYYSLRLVNSRSSRIFTERNQL